MPQCVGVRGDVTTGPEKVQSVLMTQHALGRAACGTLSSAGPSLFVLDFAACLLKGLEPESTWPG